MARRIDTLLLLALPASGKSELRRYIGSLDPEIAAADLGLGRVVQLDDYPYVHMMRRISEEMVSNEVEPAFFASSDRKFTNPWDWGTLMHLLNEDYAALGGNPDLPDSCADWLLDRFDRARTAVGIDPLDRDWATDSIEDEAARLWDDLASTVASWTDGSTVLIEFARGGPIGSSKPLPPPHGYAYSLQQLSSVIKQRASILFHGVPEEVMLAEYGTDDLIWLADQGGGGSVVIDGHTMPVAVFDNRDDHTSFLRTDPNEWPSPDIRALHVELRAALARLTGR